MEGEVEGEEDGLGAVSGFVVGRVEDGRLTSEVAVVVRERR